MNHVRDAAHFRELEALARERGEVRGWTADDLREIARACEWRAYQAGVCGVEGHAQAYGGMCGEPAHHVWTTEQVSSPATHQH